MSDQNVRDETIISVEVTIPANLGGLGLSTRLMGVIDVERRLSALVEELACDHAHVDATGETADFERLSCERRRETAEFVRDMVREMGLELATRTEAKLQSDRADVADAVGEAAAIVGLSSERRQA